ncbi:MAG TPA: WD40 repeat domain-containing protein [Gemmata sp.]
MRIIPSEHPRPLNLLAVGAAGLVVAACDWFGTAERAEAWDAATGARRWVIQPIGGGFRCLALLLDGAHLFTADSEGQRLFALPAGREPVEVSRIRMPIESAAAGNRVVVARSGADPDLWCWGVPDMNQLWVRAREDRWGPHPQFGPMALAPTGDRFALSVREEATHPKQSISVRDAHTGAPRATVSFDPADPVQQLAFTADGSKLLVRANGRTVRVFDAHTGAPAGELVHPGRPYVTGIAVHPRGPVACARTDGTVTLWDAEKGEKLRTFDWKAGRLVSIAFSPDGALGAAGTEDGKVIVWDADL